MVARTVCRWRQSAVIECQDCPRNVKAVKLVQRPVPPGAACPMSRESRLRRALAPLALTGACLLLLAATGSTGTSTISVRLPDGAIQPTARQQLLAPRI